MRIAEIADNSMAESPEDIDNRDIDNEAMGTMLVALMIAILFDSLDTHLGTHNEAEGILEEAF